MAKDENEDRALLKEVVSSKTKTLKIAAPVSSDEFDGDELFKMLDTAMSQTDSAPGTAFRKHFKKFARQPIVQSGHRRDANIELLLTGKAGETKTVSAGIPTFGYSAFRGHDVMAYDDAKVENTGTFIVSCEIDGKPQLPTFRGPLATKSYSSNMRRGMLMDTMSSGSKLTFTIRFDEACTWVCLIPGYGLQ